MSPRGWRLCEWPNTTWTGPLSEDPPTPPESESTSRAKGSRRNLGDPAFGQGTALVRIGKGEPKPMMNEHGKSAPTVVAEKPADKAQPSSAEPVEPRVGTKGNANQQHTAGLRAGKPCHRCWRAYDKSQGRKKERFTALFHHINLELLRTAFSGLRQDAAPAVDGLTWQAYAANLESNLQDLHARVQRGAYRALPSRRQYIPKPDGR